MINRVTNDARLALPAVILFALLLRLPAFAVPIDNDGGARAYHARLILEGEPLYGSHHTGHHLPAVYYTYAAAMSLFGESDGAIKGLLLLWTVPTIFILYKTGLLATGSRRAALLAALFYGLVSSHVQMWGMTAETEFFANLPRTAAVWLLLVILQDEEKPDYYFAGVGLLGAWSFLYKPIYLSAAVLFLLAMFVLRRRNRSLRRIGAATGWAVAGGLALLLPVLGYFAAQGLLPRLWLVFTLGQSYGAGNDLMPGVSLAMQWVLRPLLPLFGLGFNNAVLLVLGLSGGLLVWLRRVRPSLRWLSIWLLLSLAEAGINLELFAHYYLLVLPPLTILAGWLPVQLAADLGRHRRRAAQAAAVLLLGAVLLNSFWRNGPFWYHFGSYLLGGQTQEQMVTRGWPGFGDRLVRVAELADYVKQSSTADDQIYYWSEDVQLYFLAERRCALEMIWPIDAAATGPPQRIFAPETEMIILDLSRDRMPPSWLTAGLAVEYRLERTWADQAIYRRVNEE